MEIFNILATCAALTFGADSPAEQLYPVTDADCKHAQQTHSALLNTLTLSASDRDAIARVTYAEAGNQTDVGLAGVVYTVINRLVSGQFGDSVTAVVNAPRQFEPVGKAGGTWLNLPTVNEAQQSKIDTIINLALDGYLPDVTNGGLFFQNPAIVSDRETAGEVSKGLTHFGGSAPSATIGDHTFYASINSAGRVSVAPPSPPKAAEPPKKWDIYGVSRVAASNKNAAWNVYQGTAQLEAGEQP